MTRMQYTAIVLSLISVISAIASDVDERHVRVRGAKESRGRRRHPKGIGLALGQENVETQKFHTSIDQHEFEENAFPPHRASKKQKKQSKSNDKATKEKVFKATRVSKGDSSDSYDNDDLLAVANPDWTEVPGSRKKCDRYDSSKNCVEWTSDDDSNPDCIEFDLNWNCVKKSQNGTDSGLPSPQSATLSEVGTAQANENCEMYDNLGNCVENINTTAVDDTYCAVYDVKHHCVFLSDGTPVEPTDDFYEKPPNTNDDMIPVDPTSSPAAEPTLDPSSAPVTVPIIAPSNAPVVNPTTGPSSAPLTAPIIDPSSAPVTDPTAGPSRAPTKDRTNSPSSNDDVFIGQHDDVFFIPSGSIPTRSPISGPLTSSPTATRTRFPARAPNVNDDVLNGNNDDLFPKANVQTSTQTSSPVGGGFPTLRKTLGPTSAPSMSDDVFNGLNDDLFSSNT